MQSGTETTACTAAQPSAAVAEEVAAVLGTAAQAKCTGNTADSSVKEECAEQRRLRGGAPGLYLEAELTPTGAGSRY